MAREVVGRSIKCPKCGASIPIKGSGGRKPLKIPVNLVYDTIGKAGNIAAAALLLECSRGYIYKVIKERKNEG